MEKKETIETLYFNEGKTLTEIAAILSISVNCVSKTLQKNSLYATEKERRKKENLKKRRSKQKEIIYKYRNVDTDYQAMRKQQEQDSLELSRRSVIGNTSLRKWCSSAYKYNGKNRRYEFDTATLIKTMDFPAYIKV